MENEGFISNHPLDKGGYTYCGITYKWNKDWRGWQSCDKDFWVYHYYMVIWYSEGFDKLNSQRVADYLFDTRVSTNRKIIRKLLNKCCSFYVKGNRWVTPRLDRIRLKRFRLERLNYYKRIIKRDSSQLIFYKGWQKRVNRK